MIQTEILNKCTVPEGYKQTAVGVIPNNWGFEKFGSVSLHSAFGPRFSSDLYSSDGEVATLRTTDMDSSGNLDLSKMPLARLNVKEISTHLLQKNDLVISRSGTIGITGVFPGHYIPVIPGAFLIRFRLNTSKIEPTYLKLYFNSPEGKRRVLNLAGGGVQKNLSGTSLLNLFIPLPPLSEQQKITAILNTWDEAIEKTQKLIDQLKQRNKGLAQQLLTGKKRLKGFDGEWKKVTFDDVAKRITRRNDELNDTVVTISAQRGFVHQEDFFSKRVASETLSHYYLIHKGEFAYNKSYSNGYPMGAFKRLDRFDKAVVTTLYICFSLRENVNSNFIMHFFEAGLMNSGLGKIAQEGGRAHGLLNISLSDFFGLDIYVPELSEQQAIAKVLDQADTELKLYEQKLTSFQQQKKGLMQKLLTGEIRTI